MKKAVDSLQAQRPWNSAQSTDHIEVFPRGQVKIEIWLFRDISYLPLVSDEVLFDGLPAKANFPGAGFQQPSQHLYGRTLSRSIWPDIAEDFARPDREAHAADRDQRPIVFPQVMSIEQVRHDYALMMR